MNEIVHASTSDQVQEIDLRTPSGLILRIRYAPALSQFSTFLTKRASVRELTRGKSAMVVHTYVGERNQLPSTPQLADGQIHFCLGSATVQVHPKSVQALDAWLVHLNPLNLQAASKAFTPPIPGAAA